MPPTASNMVAGPSAANAPPKQILFGQPKLNAFIPQGKTSAYFGEKRNESSEPLFLPAAAFIEEQDELDSDRGRESSPEIGGSVFGLVGEEPKRDPQNKDVQEKEAHVPQALAPTQPEGDEQATLNAISAPSTTALQIKPINEEDLLRQIISKSKAREKTIEELQQTLTTLRVDLGTTTQCNAELRARVAELEKLSVNLAALKDKTARLAKEKLKEALQILTRYKRDVDSDWETLEGKFKKHVEDHPVISVQDITALRTEISAAREDLLNRSENSPWFAKEGKNTLALVEELKRENDRLSDALDNTAGRVKILDEELGARVAEVLLEREKNEKHENTIFKLEGDARSIQGLMDKFQTLVIQEKTHQEALEHALRENVRLELALSQTLANANHQESLHLNQSLELDEANEKLREETQGRLDDSAALRTEIESLQLALEDSKDTIDHMMIDAYEFENEHRLLQFQFDQNQSDLAEAQEDYEVVLDYATDQRFKLNNLIDEAAEKALHAEQKIADVTQELQTANTTNEALKDGIRQLQQKLQDQAATYATLSLDHNKWTAVANSRSAQISQLQTDLAAAKQNLVQTQDELRHSVMDMKDLDSELDSLRKIGQREPGKVIELRELEQSVVKLETEKQTLLQLAASRAEMIKTLQEEQSTLNTEKQQLTADCQRHLKEAQGLREQLSSMLKVPVAPVDKAVFQAENRAHRKVQDEVKKLRLELEEKDRSLRRQEQRLAEYELLTGGRTLANQPGFLTSSGHSDSSSFISDPPDAHAFWTVNNSDTLDVGAHGTDAHSGSPRDCDFASGANPSAPPNTQLPRAGIPVSPPQSHARRALTRGVLHEDLSAQGARIRQSFVALATQTAASVDESNVQTAKRKQGITSHDKPNAKKAYRRG